MTQEKVQKKVEKFFNKLIAKTDSYFLSDYVEDIEDHVGEEKAKKYVAKCDELRLMCQEVGLDIHKISCDVAQEHFKFD